MRPRWPTRTGCEYLLARWVVLVLQDLGTKASRLLLIWRLRTAISMLSFGLSHRILLQWHRTICIGIASLYFKMLHLLCFSLVTSASMSCFPDFNCMFLQPPV